jgi:AraC-like DNA-binding protein
MASLTAATVAERLLRRSAEREVVIQDPAQSMRWSQHDYPTTVAKWNYHPEYEIHLIRSTTGRFIVGDHIGSFGPGQVSLIGSGVPHDWVSDLEPGVVARNRDALVQFDGDWLKRSTADLPELLEVKALLEDSSRGLLFSGRTAAAAAGEIESMGITAGLARLAHFLQLLAILTRAPEHEREPLAREWFTPPQAESPESRAVEMGLRYIFENLTATVRMSAAARLAGMSEPRFSRFFQRASGRTFSETVRVLRITRAKILLEQTNDPIAGICYEVGFSNLSNFNRQFLREVGMTPLRYRREGASRTPPE